MSWTEKLSRLPKTPGVYLLKDSGGDTLYIGKAKNLRNRVRSYFQEGHLSDQKTRLLRRFIVDLEYIVTDSEVEALLLESHLVKKNKPRFNVHLKDDKSFPYIKLTVNEAFPRIFITRHLRKDGALYFGPYLPASLARNTLKLIHKHFQLRTCNIAIDGKLPRPCLDYHIKRCMGPCVESICGSTTYQQAVQDVKLFLEGKDEDLLSKLTDRMLEAAEREQFEVAALLRDQVHMLRALSQRQKMILNSMEDADFFGFHRQAQRLALQVFTMRGSRIVGRREFFWEDLEGFDAADFLSGALRQYYVEGSFIPLEVFIPEEIEDHLLLEEVLSNRRGQKVKIGVPKIGDRRRLLRLVELNAKVAFENRFRALKSNSEDLLAALKSTLRLEVLPRRIECFDISNLMGKDSVAAMVVCENGKMKKSDYRRFKIKTVQGANDFASMQEIIYRRYKRLLEEDQSLPDVIIVDGGKGQLSAASTALGELGLENLMLAAIAKKEEILFVRGFENRPIRLDASSPVLHLIQRIRDEAHRFAVTYHRKRRTSKNLRSTLSVIPGIGKKSQLELLRSLGSLRRIRRTSLEDLARLLGHHRGERVYRHFHPPGAH